MSRQPPSTRDQYKGFVPLQTRWADNDAYGHLNNATYLSLFDTAMSLWQLQNGIDIQGPDALRFLVVESGCRYFAELAFPEDLSAGLRIPHIGTSSYRMEFALFKAGQSTAAAEGFFAQVLTDPSSTPIPIPPQTRAILETLG